MIDDPDNYVIYRRANGDFISRYGVLAPGGDVIDVTMTIKGARRAIAKHRRFTAKHKGVPRAWGDNPVVECVPAEESIDGRQ